jgi:CHAD domain-containing protein
VSHEVDPKPGHNPRDDRSGFGPALFRDAEAAFGLNEEPGEVTKAEPVPIRPDMTVADAVEAVVESCIAHFRTNELVVASSRESAALHQVRVSVRRLRAALSLFRPALADNQFDTLRHELRWFARQLGEARNLDVFLLRKDLPKPLRAAVKMEREIAYDRLIEALRSKRLRLLLIDLVAWVELGRWRQNRKASRPLGEFVARRLYKWWQRLVRLGDIEPLHADQRHELRIETKKLRYALDFVQPLHSGAERKQKQFTKSLERLQDSLGKLNDAVTARELWRRFGQGLPRPKSDEHEVEGKRLRSAQASLDRLRKIGPYWTRLG